MPHSSHIQATIKHFRMILHHHTIDDGGPSKKPQQEPQDNRGGSISSSKVRERVLTLLDQLSVLPRLRSMHEPNFVYLFGGRSEGIISYTPFPHQAKNRSFQIS